MILDYVRRSLLPRHCDDCWASDAWYKMASNKEAYLCKDCVASHGIEVKGHELTDRVRWKMMCLTGQAMRHQGGWLFPTDIQDARKRAIWQKSSYYLPQS